MRSKGLPHRQAYNVQTAVTEQQIILAAEISLDAPEARRQRMATLIDDSGRTFERYLQRRATGRRSAMRVRS
jgi:hypothetical protein